MKLLDLAKRLQKCFFHRLPLKIVAFVLAVLLFFAANAERAAQRENEMISRAVLVDLVTAAQEPGYVPINLPKKVEVLAQSPIGTTISSELRALVNLHGRKAGEYTVPVHVYLPKGWKLLEVRPQVISITVEPIESRSFIVTLIAPEESQMESAVPLQCNVQGPSSTVKQVRAVTGFVNTDFSGPADVRLTPVDRDGQPVPGAVVFPEWVRIDPSGVVESYLGLEDGAEEIGGTGRGGASGAAGAAGAVDRADSVDGAGVSNLAGN